MDDIDALYFLDSCYLMWRWKARRKEWINDIFRERMEFGEYHSLFSQLKKQPVKFREYFRMEYHTFLYILKEVEPLIKKQNTNFRESISAEERLVVTIRYLATGASFRALAFSFRISNNRISDIVKETCKAIFDTLVSKHMPKPTREMLIRNAEMFYEMWGFPNCFGSLDGKHIRLKCPSNSGSMYFNYKKFFSIILQAVVSPDYKFLIVEVGAYGQQSDGGVFANSLLYQHIDNNFFGTNILKCLPNTNIALPLVLLADEAYPLKRNIMRPYSRRDLGIQETVFNQRLSNGRVIVECVFGSIAQKWRILTKAIETTTENAEHIVKCICLLHNVIIDLEGCPIERQFRHPSSHDVPRIQDVRYSSHSNRSTHEAYTIREQFKAFFCTEV